ncbi:MAG: hypothetical protein ISR65_08230 [Bacteriovoracaceae bacterium]|nr:hypothetical protein [Bacteriovoracaceae bacterium]
MNKKIWCIIFFLSVTSAYPKDLEPDINYYNSLYLGQIDTEDYFGPIHPDYYINLNTRKKILKDEKFKNDYFIPYLESDIFQASNYWHSELMQSSTCPNYYLNQNIPYFRYLYRLLAISYLFEALKEYHITLYQLGFNSNRCNLSWKKTFAKCNGNGDEINKFLKRIRYRHLKGLAKQRLIRKSKKEVRQWIRRFNKVAKQKVNDILPVTYLGLLRWCKQNNIDCSQLSKNQIQIGLSISCKVDKVLLKNLCNGNDNLYGASYIPEMTVILTKSDTLNTINITEFGIPCLRRFITQFKVKERRYDYLGQLFPVIRAQLMKHKDTHRHGDLFILGALKKFDDLGMSDFLVSLPPPVFTPPKPKAKPIVKRTTPKPKPAPVVIHTPLPKPKPTPPPPPKEAPKVVEKISQFELATKKRAKNKLPRVKVNMLLMKNDFIFTSLMTEKLKEPLQEYQTRKAIKEMRRFDGLGTKKEPVRLMFLKYLIDNSLHQALYNITAILGNQFYVLNDIDRIQTPVFIELLNSKSTNHRWQINILEDKLSSKHKKRFIKRKKSHKKKR